MGKKCVQAVRSSGRNYEDRFPHLPHYLLTLTQHTISMCVKAGSFAAVVRAEHTGIYTGIIGKITGTKRYLSSVSTAPIITTTTYI